jgi:hypothetical protein
MRQRLKAALFLGVFVPVAWVLLWISLVLTFLNWLSLNRLGCDKEERGRGLCSNLLSWGYLCSVCMFA